MWQNSLIADTWHRSVGQVGLQEFDTLREVRVHGLGRTPGGVDVAGARVSRLTATLVQNAEIRPRGCVTLI